MSLNMQQKGGGGKYERQVKRHGEQAQKMSDRAKNSVAYATG